MNSFVLITGRIVECRIGKRAKHPWYRHGLGMESILATGAYRSYFGPIHRERRLLVILTIFGVYLFSWWAFEIAVSARLNVASELLATEMRHEVGPNYKVGLETYRRILERVIELLRRRRSLASSADRSAEDYAENALKVLLMAREGSDDEVRRAILQAQQLVEKCCSTLIKAVPLSRALNPDIFTVDRLAKSSRVEVVTFCAVADRYVAEPTFEGCEQMCMQSRIATMSLLLVPSIVNDDTALAGEVSKMIMHLGKAIETTRLMATHEQDAQIAGRLAVYASGEERRLRILRNLRDAKVVSLVLGAATREQLRLEHPIFTPLLLSQQRIGKDG